MISAWEERHAASLVQARGAESEKETAGGGQTAWR